MVEDEETSKRRVGNRALRNIAIGAAYVVGIILVGLLIQSVQ